MASNLTISKQIYLPNLIAGLTYDIDTYAEFGYTIVEVDQIQTSAGTVTAAIQIGGTNVTGLSSISVSSTPQNVSATGANTVAAGNRVQIVFSSNSGATNINMTLKATRTAVSSVSNSDGTLTASPTAGDVVVSLASLSSGKLLVGNGSNVATGVSMSGDATLANTGAVTVTKTSGAAFTSYATAAVGQLPGTTTNDNASAGNIGEYLYCTAVKQNANVTISNASPCVVTWSGHGLNGWTPVVFTTTGSLPAGLTAGTVYWVIPSSITASTFEVSSSIGGSAVNTTSNGSGTQTCTVGYPLTTSTETSVGALSLTAGDWDVWGMVQYVPTGLATTYFTGLSSAVNTLGNGTEYALLNGVTFASGAPQVQLAPPLRFSLSATTTIYMTSNALFSTGAMIATGSLYARRVR